MSLTKILFLALIFILPFQFISCKKKGCMDNTASNYDSSAEKDDGSCMYNISTTQNIVRVESVCGDNSTLIEYYVTCEVYLEINSYVLSNVGNPCMFYTFIDINGQEISGYIRSMTGCG